ncbi:SDR family NAD(P)-dependent oxidoreductase [Okeania hirsuta]|uniref:SDR family NAD(P)-dependent oxidoreductase n=1 Tax=Okeania hirsuta TaxID=1458930 RepID=UPI000F53378C|nr:SDR family oxidoreductase [Okeania hirsuta]RQH23974.1 SDR family oxidoreductase [Okeania hirsuta]
MQKLENIRVLITGVGIKPVRHIFRDIVTNESSHTPVIHNGDEYKANLGASTAFSCAEAGAIVHLVARSGKNLKIVKDWITRSIPRAKVEISTIDLLDKQETEIKLASVSNDIPLYWVQSLGLGAGTVKIRDNNPYLKIDEVSEEFIDAELSVLKSTYMTLQALLPRFRKQAETRICIVSSMSGIRSFVSGSVHNSAKGAISRFANAISLELAPEKIYVSNIRPGGCDTGLYDENIVKSRIAKIRESFGFGSDPDDIRLMPPSSVGKAIVNILSSDGHITSVNIVARGQMPHEVSN